jgi:hypothetical protein
VQISPFEYILFVALALLALGYEMYDDGRKKSGAVSFVLGLAGIVGVGISVFSNWLPLPHAIPVGTPTVAAFVAATILLAGLVILTVQRARSLNFWIACRNVGLLLLGMWVIAHLIGYMFSFSPRMSSEHVVSRIVYVPVTAAPTPTVLKMSVSDSAKSGDMTSACIQAPPRPKPDLRLAPFAENSTFFTASLPADNEGVRVWCFPYEIESCDIAMKYRSRLSENFTVLPWHGFLTGLSNVSSSDFKGVNVGVQSVKSAPEGATKLQAKLQELGIPSQLTEDEDCAPGDFSIWIGGQP